MSVRLHYCTEYKVRRSDNAIGNYDSEIINNLFHWLNLRADHNYEFWFNDDSLSFSTVIEWDKQGVEDAIQTLTDMVAYKESWQDIPVYTSDDEDYAAELEKQGVPHSDRDWSMDKWLRDKLLQAEIETTWCNPKALAEFLIEALNNSEPTIDYVRFEWV